MSQRSYSLLGRWARAAVTYADGLATLTGHCAGELVCRAFGPDDSEEFVFGVARALAFEARGPAKVAARSGETLDMLEAVP